MYEKFEKFGLDGYPPEIRGRFNSFITTQFDDSLSVEMQLRSIIKWAKDNFDETVNQTNNFIDFINDLIEYMNEFIETFDTKYQETILNEMQEWYENGELERLINESLDTKYHEMDKEFTTQFARTDQQLSHIETSKAEKTEMFDLLGKISEGTPLFADSLEEMTDVDRLYVHSSGVLYAHDGNEFVSTGVNYQNASIGDNTISHRHFTDNFLYDGRNALPLGTTLADLEKTGFYLTTGTPSDRPSGANTTGATILNLTATNPNYKVMLYFDRDGQFYYNVRSSGSGFQGWKKVWDSTSDIPNESIGFHKLHKNFMSDGSTVLSSDDSLNEADKTALYLNAGATDGLPDGASSTGLLLNLLYQNDDYRMQQYIDINNRIWHRVHVANEPKGFREWKETIEEDQKPLHEKEIVLLGDSLTIPTAVTDGVEFRTGANVMNVGFGGTRASQHDSRFDPFSFYRLVDEIIKEESDSTKWYLQEEVIRKVNSGEMEGVPEYFEARLNWLKNIDWSSVDYAMVAYGTNDFTAGVSVDNPNDLTHQFYFGGALRQGLEKIMTKYPHLNILLCTPSYRFWEDGEDSNTKVIEGQTLIEFVEKVEEIGKEFHLPVSENYYELGINKFNRDEYIRDGTHHNNTGAYKLGHKRGSDLVSKT